MQGSSDPLHTVQMDCALIKVTKVVSITRGSVTRLQRSQDAAYLAWNSICLFWNEPMSPPASNRYWTVLTRPSLRRTRRRSTCATVIAWTAGQWECSPTSYWWEHHPSMTRANRIQKRASAAAGLLFLQLLARAPGTLLLLVSNLRAILRAGHGHVGA